MIINRALVYATLTLTYFGSVALLQHLLRSLTGQETQLAIVASPLGIVAFFQPLRRRIQNTIDRRFYRRKYDAARTLEAYAARLREETNLEQLSGTPVSMVKKTVQPAHVSFWLREQDRGAQR